MKDVFITINGYELDYDIVHTVSLAIAERAKSGYDAGCLV